MKHPAALGVILLVMLGGCATTPGKPSPLAENSAPAQQLHTDLVREMVAQGRYYAALAHIEELQRSGGPREELLLLHAQVQAKLGRGVEAEKEFRQLLGGGFAGEAQHGLGLLYASRDFRQSLLYLREAARLQPTDAGVRNDYGYALLTGGYYRDARLQLATAYELDAGLDKYRNNYVLVLLLLKEEAEVKRVRQRSEMSDKTLQTLRARVQQWPALVQRTQAVAGAAPAPAPGKAAPAANASKLAERQRETKKNTLPGL